MPICYRDPGMGFHRGMILALDLLEPHPRSAVVSLGLSHFARTLCRYRVDFRRFALSCMVRVGVSSFFGPNRAISGRDPARVHEIRGVGFLRRFRSLGFSDVGGNHDVL